MGIERPEVDGGSSPSKEAYVLSWALIRAYVNETISTADDKYRNSRTHPQGDDRTDSPSMPDLHDWIPPEYKTLNTIGT